MPDSYESAILENPQVPQKCIVHREKIEKLQHDFDMLVNNNVQKGNEVDKLCVKIEETIQKLGDLTLSITKMMALHDSRLQYIERTAENANALVLAQNEKYILQEMQTQRNKDEIANTNTHFERLETLFMDRFEKIDKRIGTIEIWRWMVIGGCLIAIFALNQLPNYIGKFGQ
jgi:hypothetical protein